MRTKERINTYRTTATVVGVVWLAGFVLAVVGNNLILSILGAPNPPFHGFREQHAGGNRRDAYVDLRRCRGRSRGLDVPGPETTQ